MLFEELNDAGEESECGRGRRRELEYPFGFCFVFSICLFIFERERDPLTHLSIPRGQKHRPSLSPLSPAFSPMLNLLTDTPKYFEYFLNE